MLLRGALIAERSRDFQHEAADLAEFENFLKALVFLQGKPCRGRRAGLMSNAGFECVLMADNLKDGAPAIVRLPTPAPALAPTKGAAPGAGTGRAGR